MSKICDVVIPKWLSVRTYFLGTEKSRTYIINEKNHTNLQLDGISSDFFYYLYNDNSKLEDFIKNNHLENDTDSFLENLALQNIIILKGFKVSYQDNNEKDMRKLSDEYQEFRNEQSLWFFKNHLLSTLFIELTYRCNLKCIHCYNPKNISSIEIPFDKLKQIIDDAYKLGCLYVILSGGESTTYSHIIELITYIREKGMSVAIFSNGLRLAEDEKFYQKLLSLYITKYSISFYGTTAETHEKVTDVLGSYQKTKKVIEKLIADGQEVQIKDFLLNVNCNECLEMKKYGNKLGCQAIADISLIPTIEGDKKTFKYMLSDDELFNLFINPDSPLYIGENPVLRNFENYKYESLCMGGFTSLCITPTLNVTVCSSFPYAFGNLKHESLLDIWKEAVDKNPNSKLNKWWHITGKDLEECYKYDYCAFCNYCPGMGYLENGFLKKSDVLCRQAKIKQKAYEYIKRYINKNPK